MLTGSFALRARGNNCTVSNNTFIDPFTNGYVLDNKILTGTNGTNNVTYTTNNIVFTDAKSNYSFDYVTYNNTSVSPSPKTIPVGFVRNGWKLNKGSLYLYVIGLGKIQFSDMTSFLVAAGTSGAHSTIETAHSLAVDGNEIIADNAISAPAISAITKNVAIRSASTAYLYNSNAILSYNLASNSHLLKIMQDAVQIGVPKVELSAYKISTTGYTELVMPKTESGILSKDLYVSGSSDIIALGITPVQIIGNVNVAALPSTTTVDIAPVLGTSSSITISSTSIDIPDSLAGQINPVALSSAVSVSAGQQLVDAVGTSKVVIAKPAADAPATIPVTVIPNDSASTQVASIEVPAGGSQVAVEVKPNGVISSSGAIKIKSPTSNPIKVIDLVTGIEYTGIDISIGSGNFGSFTQATRVQVISF